jgi:DNA invertase Pin-like site-specific DNA recombinase
VTEPIDTSNPMGEMIFTLLAGFAAEERHSADTGRQAREGEPRRVLRWRGTTRLSTGSSGRPVRSRCRESNSLAHF